MLLYPLSQNQPSWVDSFDQSDVISVIIALGILLLITFFFKRSKSKEFPGHVVGENKKNISNVNTSSKSKKENLEEMIKAVHKAIKEKSNSEAYKLAKSFHDKLDRGEIESQDKLDKMIESHCNSFSDAEVIKIRPQFTFIVTYVSTIFTEWNKTYDLKKINPKGYNEVESIYSLALDFHTKFGSLEERISKAKRDLNPTKDKALDFNDFSETEKDIVLYHARLRALSEVMISDGENHPSEISILSQLSEKYKKISKPKLPNQEVIQDSKEYKFIWGDPVDLKNRENLTLAVKSMENLEMNTLFEDLLLLAISDKEFHLKERNYIRNLYSDCKGISKQKATSWINSKLKEWNIT